jgi:hypothetical protein
MYDGQLTRFTPPGWHDVGAEIAARMKRLAEAVAPDV